MIHELLALGGVAVSMVGLGLVMGASPTLYAIVMRVLTTATDPVTAVRWITVGVGAGTTVLLLLFRVIDPETLTALVADRAGKLLVRRVVDLVAGAVFLVLAIRAVLGLRRPERPTKPAAPPRLERPGPMFLTGLANALIGVSGMATMYVTGRVLASASRDPLVLLVLYAVFLVAVVGPYLLLSVLWHRFPVLGHRVTALTGRLAAIDTRPLLVAALFLAAAVFLLLGIFGYETLRGLLPGR